MRDGSNPDDDGVRHFVVQALAGFTENPQAIQQTKEGPDDRNLRDQIRQNTSKPNQAGGRSI
jgi:hypothetical protein